MRLKKLFTLGLLVLFALTTLVACSKDKKTKESGAYGFDTNSIIGKVTDINKSTITLALYEMPNRGMGNNDQNGGPMPSGAPDRNNKNRENNNYGNGQGPNGTPGANRRGDMNGFFKETGETKTIDVTDESLIKIRSGRDETQGSLKDITVNSMITVQYEDDGSTIKAIVVQGQSNNNTDQSNADNSNTQ